MDNKRKLSRNLGFITGPLMIFMGVFSLQGDRIPIPLAYFFIGMGIIRLGLTLYVFFKSKE